MFLFKQKQKNKESGGQRKSVKKAHSTLSLLRAKRQPLKKEFVEMY